MHDGAARIGAMKLAVRASSDVGSISNYFLLIWATSVLVMVLGLLDFVSISC